VREIVKLVQVEIFNFVLLVNPAHFYKIMSVFQLLNVLVPVSLTKIYGSVSLVLLLAKLVIIKQVVLLV
jgi:hypothetical protein